jgi:hypothetical protein
VKKNLFNNHLDNSLSEDQSSDGLQVGQITCEPCSLEVEKMNMKINGRKLSEIEKEEVSHIFSPFSIDS